MTKLYGYILALLGAIASLVAVYAKGRQAGKATEKTKTLEQQVTTEKAKNETLETVIEVRDDIGRLDSDSVEQRLRDKYQRD